MNCLLITQSFLFTTLAVTLNGTSDKSKLLSWIIAILGPVQVIVALCGVMEARDPSNHSRNCEGLSTGGYKERWHLNGQTWENRRNNRPLTILTFSNVFARARSFSWGHFCILHG